MHLFSALLKKTQQNSQNDFHSEEREMINKRTTISLKMTRCGIHPAYFDNLQNLLGILIVAKKSRDQVHDTPVHKQIQLGMLVPEKVIGKCGH